MQPSANIRLPFRHHAKALVAFRNQMNRRAWRSSGYAGYSRLNRCFAPGFFFCQLDNLT